MSIEVDALQLRGLGRPAVTGVALVLVALDHQSTVVVDHVEVADRVRRVFQRIVADLVGKSAGGNVELQHADGRLAVDQFERLRIGIPEGLFEQRIECLAIGRLGHALKAAGTLGNDASQFGARIGGGNQCIVG